MQTGISFPHLGISFANVKETVHFMGMDVSVYGIIMGIAVLVGIILFLFEMSQTRRNVDEYAELSIVSVVAGILGARFAYVFFAGRMTQLFAIRRGGLLFLGGLMTAVAAGVIWANYKDLQIRKTLDIATLGLLVGQIIGRFGEFFNRDYLGEYTEGIFAMQLPIHSVDVTSVTERMKNHIDIVDGVRCIQAHPLFLYEIMLCIGILIVVGIYRFNKKNDGEVFFLYLFLYSIGKIWLESLHTGGLSIPGFGLNAVQVLAIVCALGSLLVFVYLHVQSSGNKRKNKLTLSKELRKKH